MNTATAIDAQLLKNRYYGKVAKWAAVAASVVGFSVGMVIPLLSL